MFKKIIITLLAITLLPFVTSSVYAQQTSKGMGEIQYDGRFKKKNYSQYQQSAIEIATQSAWTRYVGSLPQLQQTAYFKIESKFTSNLSRYISDVTILDESHDKKSKTVQVIVRMSVNSEAVSTTLNENSAVKMAGEDASLFSFVFVARQTTSIKSYDAKVTKIQANESMSTASSDSTVIVNENEVSLTESGAISQDSKSFNKTTTGGSSEQKADKVSYTVTSAQDIDSAMGNTLSIAGYEIVDYGDIVGECGGAEPDTIKAEFSVNDDMSRQTRRSAIKGAKNCEVKYFSVGTIDIGMKDVDPVSGNQRVYVSVRAQVWNIEKRLPKKVASVGPIQFAGLGPDQVVAQRNALILAAKEASQSIVDQMNAKGLH